MGLSMSINRQMRNKRDYTGFKNLITLTKPP